MMAYQPVNVLEEEDNTETSKDGPSAHVCFILLGKESQNIPSNWVLRLLSGVDRRCVFVHCPMMHGSVL